MKAKTLARLYQVALLLVMALWAYGCQDTVQPGIPIEGTWGAQHIALVATANGATLEYDCAHGTIDQQVIPDQDGHFDLAGTHVWEHGGPIQPGEEEILPARYQGFIYRNRMTLTVTLTDSDEVLGPYILIHDEPGTVFKCL